MSDTSNRATAPADLDPALAGLEPAHVWRVFGDICRIPHETGNEAGVRAYAKAFAASHGIACEENAVGDILLRVNPASPGPVVGLQAHMDMVCVSKDGAPYDFANEPIRLKRDGDSIHADGTSLGADNGIGVAYALALAEEATGPIEVLLTVDEERGFTGIDGVEPGWLKAKCLINLDSEEEGFVTIASAGGRDFLVRLPVERGEAADATAVFTVTSDGLLGGHSGVDIHLGRTNALKVAGKVLEQALHCGGVVYSVQGGTAPNVIPSSSKALVAVPPARVQEFQAALAALRERLHSHADPSLRIEAASATGQGRPLTRTSADQLVRLLDELPHGVLVPSPRDPSQPFVSNNVGIVKTVGDDAVEFTLMSRSPASQELEKLEGRYGEVGNRHGAVVTAGRTVPGWAPDYNSPLLALFQKIHTAHYGKEARVLEIHAGLECGALQVKYPGMDLISVGPDMTGVHSPAEQVSAASVLRVFNLVRAVIRELHQQ